MRACPRCGHENPDDTDFCEKCRTYLRWEPTRVVSAVPPPAEKPASDEKPAGESDRTRMMPTPPPAITYQGQGAAGGGGGTQAAPGVEPEAVVVSVRLPGGEEAGGAPVTTTVDAGGQTTLVALVRNQSGIVDNYDLRVTGVPEGWWTATPETVYLVPFGSPGGSYEEEVEIKLHPPRSPDAEARPWPIQVVANPHAAAVEAGSAAATLVVNPYRELETEIRPEQDSGRFRGSFAVAVRNRANAPTDVVFAGADPESVLAFTFEKPTVTVDPGRRAGTSFSVRPPKQILVGRAVERRFEVSARAVDSDEELARPGAFRQLPWLPWWLALVVPAAVAAVVAVLALLPHNATVPDLTKSKNVFAAQAVLTKSGLVLGDVTEKKTKAARPGTILAQTPDSGEKVAKKSAVSIEVAVGTGKAEVPKVVGLTLAAADVNLRKKGFTLGQARPEPTDPDTQKIATQIPAAGVVADRGTAVSVFYETPPTTTASATTAATTAAASTGAATSAGETTATTATTAPTTAATTAATTESGGLPQEFAVPVLGGLASVAYVDAIVKAGLVPEEVRRFDADAPAGTVVGVDPAEGTAVQPGTRVQVIVSAGFPTIAFDAGGNVLLAGGAKGKPVTAIAKSDEIEEQPSWNPTGTLMAYRRGTADQGRIWTVDPEKPQSARPLTDKGFDDRRPAFSPNGQVIAFVRGSSVDADHDLCFVRVDSPTGTPRCIVDPDHNVSRPAWAPDGQAILVVSNDTVDQQQVELLEYTSANPSSGKPPDWNDQGLVTDGMHGKKPGDEVVAAAWSPDGSQVALTANWTTGVAQLFLVESQQDQLGEAKSVPSVRGCEVSWRSDGAELALTQRDALCDQPGVIVRIDPAAPKEAVTLTKLGAENPAWSPVPPEG